MIQLDPFNLGDSHTILKWFWGESWWFANHSEMNLEKVSVIHKLFWLFRESSRINENQESSLIIDDEKKEELIFQNI